ncbi:ATP-binding cassette domain-containing protein [Pedobacter sp. MW01-1-1]|uniref:ATP-binding cassette domain-containing protein n=1 Tax=Pedobacter sp. MW01-1-1 TaxID=3383027 RepID=UPI003FEF9CFE
MAQPFVHISNLTLKYQHKVVLSELDWTIQKNENWLLQGLSGSGKTALAKAIVGLVPFSGEITIHFDPHSTLPAKALYVDNWYQFKDLEGQSNFYYQQRYNHQQAHSTHTVQSELTAFGKENNLSFGDLDEILAALNFSNLLPAQLIQLSSGEHKKMQLVKALWLKPQLLLLDQPYTGLDATSRKNLNHLLNQIAAAGVQYIFIGDGVSIPDSINRYAEVREGKIHVSETKRTLPFPTRTEKKHIPYFLSQAPASVTENFISMKDVTIRYGDKSVLKNVNWEVKAGEKWLLQGHNGSGKSTLLSLINGDHPQAYANDIHLFGNKRGSGESIWDIKSHIGLISPELHWYFDPSATVFQSIASGFFDSSGLFKTIGAEKKLKWKP